MVLATSVSFPSRMQQARLRTQMSLSAKFQERTACSMVIKVFGNRGERGPFGRAIGALGRGHEDVKPLGKRDQRGHFGWVMGDLGLGLL
jgi:hypothetical protein